MPFSERIVQTPLNEKETERLMTGERVLLTGVIYTARDAVHQRLAETLMTQGAASLPFSLNGQVLYYTGPAPAKPGQVIGPAGPTTSSRMDPTTPLLLEYGLKGMIGKGDRSQEVVDAIKRYRAVYFAAVGGTGVLLARKVIKAEAIAYHDLGPEAVYRLEVRDFPVIVAIDTRGTNIYRETHLQQE